MKPLRTAPRRALGIALTALFATSAAALAQFQPLFPGGGIPINPAEGGTFWESDLGHSIGPFVDGDLTRRFEALRGEVAAGRFDVAVEALGRLLEERGGSDVFLGRSGGQETERAFAAEARRLLAELPPAAREQYETLFGPAARALLLGAQERDDAAGTRDVAVRYVNAQAGAEALLQLGVMHRDAGRMRDAALCWERVRELPHAGAFEPHLSLRLAAAWRACGEVRLADQIVERLAAMPAGALRVAGAEVRWSPDELAGIVERMAGPVSPPSLAGAAGSDEAWPVHGGGPSRIRSVEATDPLLVPRWSQPLTNDDEVTTAVEQAFQYSVATGTARLPLPSPVAAGELVLLRSVDGVRAFDAATGQLLWMCPVELTNGDGLHHLWRDSACGSLAADGGASFLVEPAASEPVPQLTETPQNPALRMLPRQFWGRLAAGFGGPLGTVEETRASSAVPNLLTSRAFKPPRQGNLLWRVGGNTGHAEPRLAGMHFVGTPLPHAGRVLVLGERGDVLHLAVLDASTGALEWLQPLATVPRGIDTDPFRRAAGATPSISDGIAVCPTSGGGAVAVDLVLRSLLWVYRYPRREESVSAPDEGLTPNLEQRDRWIDSSAVIAGGRVLLAPPESEHLHCLDLRTGKRLWRVDRGDGLFIGAVHEGQVVVVGNRHLSAVKLDNGKPAWTIPLVLPENSLPTGRGLHAGKHYYLPLSNASIGVFDLDVGWLARVIRSPRQIVSGNLIYHRGTFISQGPLLLEAFDDRIALEQRTAAALRADPSDAEALTRQGDLELASGRLEEALAAFRRAWEAAPTPRTRNRYSAALFDAIRERPEREAEFNAELDRLVR